MSFVEVVDFDVILEADKMDTLNNTDTVKVSNAELMYSEEVEQLY